MNKKVSMDEFAEEIFKYAKNTFDNIELTDGHIIKIKGLKDSKDVEEEIKFGINNKELELDVMYSTYLNSTDLNYDWAKNNAVDLIQRCIDRSEGKPLLDITPIIRSEKLHGEDLVGEKFTLDLDILYTIRNRDKLSLITPKSKFDNLSYMRIKEFAMQKLDFLEYAVERFGDTEVYCLRGVSSKDVTITGILLKLDEVHEIIDILGKNFLFIILEDGALFFAKDTEENVLDLKWIIDDYLNSDFKDSVISDRIYSYNDGEILFYE